MLPVHCPSPGRDALQSTKLCSFFTAQSSRVCFRGTKTPARKKMKPGAVPPPFKGPLDQGQRPSGPSSCGLGCSQSRPGAAPAAAGLLLRKTFSSGYPAIP